MDERKIRDPKIQNVYQTRTFTSRVVLQMLEAPTVKRAQLSFIPIELSFLEVFDAAHIFIACRLLTSTYVFFSSCRLVLNHLYIGWMVNNYFVIRVSEKCWKMWNHILKLIWLVVSTPLKNMSSSVEMIIPKIWNNKKWINMFQTTNQYIDLLSQY